jgi:hypothetical protein
VTRPVAITGGTRVALVPVPDSRPPAITVQVLNGNGVPLTNTTTVPFGMLEQFSSVTINLDTLTAPDAPSIAVGCLDTRIKLNTPRCQDPRCGACWPGEIPADRFTRQITEYGENPW